MHIIAIWNENCCCAGREFFLRDSDYDMDGRPKEGNDYTLYEGEKADFLFWAEEWEKIPNPSSYDLRRAETMREFVESL